MDEETLKQQIHELKLALKTSKSLQQDANIENERLVIELKNRDEQIVATKKSHDDEIRVIKEELFNSTNVYETEKLALQGQIEEYKAQLDNAKLEKHVKSDSSDLDELINEIKDEKQKNLKLSTEVDELKDEIGELKAEKHRTDQKLTELSRMYEETRESLDIKKAYLDEIQNALKECQEEKALLSSKLDILTTGPATSIERGNSLFKEVEDNRKKMANAYKILKTKYLRVQDTLMGKNQEIARLKTQIVSLKNVELTFGEDDQKSQNKYIDSCEKRIKELESFVHMLEKRKESPEIVTLSDNNYLQLQWVHTIVDGARSEARKTIADCQKMSFDSYEKASALLRAEMELKNLKIEVIRKDGRIEELESKVSQLQGELKENIPTPHVAVDVLSASKSSNKTVRFVDDSALEETCLDTK